MRRVLADSIFDVFLRKNCEELFDEYREKTTWEASPIEDRLESWFILGCTCVLCKNNSVGTWLALLKSINLREVEDLETARSIAVSFLGAHLDRLHLDFSRPLAPGAEFSLSRAFSLSVSSGRLALAVLCLQSAGWHYAVLGQDDVSYSLFSLGFRLALSQGLHPIFAEFCQCGIYALKGLDADPKWMDLTRYFYREIRLTRSRFPLQDKESLPGGEIEVDRDLDERIFGLIQHESFLDILAYDRHFLDRIASFDDRSANEWLFANLMLGRDIVPEGLNPDSFLVAGPALDSYFVSKDLQDKPRKRIMQAFSDFVEQGGFQRRFRRMPHLFAAFFTDRMKVLSEREMDSDSAMNDLVLKMGCDSIYSRTTKSFFEPLRNAGIQDDGGMEFPGEMVSDSYQRCLENLDGWIDQSQVALPARWRVNLCASLLQRTEDEKYASFLADSFRQTVDFGAKVSFSSLYDPYDALLGKPGKRTLLSFLPIRSIAVDRYIEDPAYGKAIEGFLSSYGGEGDSEKLGLYQAERLAFHLDLLESDGWKGKTDLLDGKEVFQLSSKDGRYIVFYLMSQEGEWREIHQGTRLELVSSPGFTIPSPVQVLDEYVNGELGFVENPVLKVLVPFSNVYFSQPEIFIQNLRDVHVVHLKQLLELVGASIGPESSSFYQLLADAVPDVEQLRSAATRSKTKDNWDFLNLILFCQDHPTLRKDLKSDVLMISDLYEQVSHYGPVVLLSRYIRSLLDVFPAPSESVSFSYCCTMPAPPYSLISEIQVKGDQIRIVDFRFEEQSRRVGVSDNLHCRQAGTLLQVGASYARFHHDLRIVGDSRYLRELFSREEEEGILADRGGAVKTVARIFRDVVLLFQGVFQDWQKNQETLVTSFQIRRFAEESARTAIMARNMSHNLGSHVMAYLKQHLASVHEMLRNNVFDQLFKNEKELETLLNDPARWHESIVRERRISSVENITLPFLVGLGRFFSYLQERQDFIASVATNYIPSCSSLDFKDFIYDELNPDKRYKRHSDRKGELPDNILLGNIARSEGLMRITRPTAGSNESARDIILAFREFDGEPVEPVPGNTIWKPGEYYGDHLSVAQDALDAMRKYSLSIPGGITGRHAIFSIIENIIRNASKHGNWQDKDVLKITFDIYNSFDYEKRLTDQDGNALVDNIPGELPLYEVLRRFYAGATDGQSLYYVTVTDNLDTSYAELSKLRRAINEEYVSAQGRMVETSKGIKEMRICSSWLRGFRKKSDEHSPVVPGENDTSWLNENEEWGSPAPVLYARLSHDPQVAPSSDSGHLQFIFAVRIPVRVLIVSPRFANDDLADIGSSFLDRYYWAGVTPDLFLEKWAGRNYDFLLLDGESDTLYQMIRLRSSTRLILVRDIPAFSFEKLKEKEPAYLEEIWLKLWEKLSDYHPGEDWISVDDGRTKLTDEGARQLEGMIKVGKEIECGPYIYQTHYESRNEFYSFKDRCRRRGIKYRYIEGISGGNSTDRLVRCDTIDKGWFFKHLHVMKERIAIFDERLSNLVYGIDSSSILSLDKDHTLKCPDYKGILFADKYISVFNFVRIDDSSFALYGLYRGEKELNLLRPKNPYCFCKRIATISKEDFFSKDDFIQIDDSYYGQPQVRYDRISIHQGLLDKMYDAFGIKDVREMKEKLTTALYRKFMGVDASFLIEGTSSRFLPGMTIHSGRSKPSEDDMPQVIPFIQYASLEHAFLDCKYSLVELLDSAIYE